MSTGIRGSESALRNRLRSATVAVRTLKPLGSQLKSAQDEVDRFCARSVEQGRAFSKVQEQMAKAVADKAGLDKQLREQEAVLDTARSVGTSPRSATKAGALLRVAWATGTSPSAARCVVCVCGGRARTALDGGRVHRREPREPRGGWAHQCRLQAGRARAVLGVTPLPPTVAPVPPLPAFSPLSPLGYSV